MAEQPTLQSTPQPHQAAKMPELAFDENRVNGDTTTSTERYRSNSDPVEVVPRRRKNSTQSTSSSDSDSSGILRRKNRSLINRNGHNNNNEGEVRPHDDDCLVRRRSASVLEVKEHAQDRLRDELLKAQSELMLKDEECKKLEHVRDQMCEELEELTAKLFEEANKMVQDANIKRMNSEKLLKDANSQNEILQAEVTALKSLVLTSTPSTPNRHLHPQIDTRPPTGQSGNGGNSKKSSTLASFVKGHRRSTSHHNFAKEMRTVDIDLSKPVPSGNSSNDNREIDPVVFEEFRAWRATKTLDPESQFLSHVIREDISPCFSFSNKQLSQSVFNCVKNNTITIEPVSEKNLVPTKCALTQTSTICPYQIRLGINNEPFHNISQLARNRITAVCDFYTYARYITQGLVKSDDGEVYWEVVRLRKQMALARLGLTS